MIALRLWNGMFALLMFVLASSAGAAETPPASEIHSFKVVGKVSYRCYGGYGSSRASDSRTGVVCDNQTVKQTLIDETVYLKIVNEPTPDDSKDLVGDWLKEVEFKGRKFVVAMTLWKEIAPGTPAKYRLRLVAQDDEPGHRGTAVFVEADRVKRFNPLVIQYNSRGQPEEISFDATVSAR